MLIFADTGMSKNIPCTIDAKMLHECVKYHFLCKGACPIGLDGYISCLPCPQEVAVSSKIRVDDSGRR